MRTGKLNSKLILLAIWASPILVFAQALTSPLQSTKSSVWITRIDPPIAVTLVPGTSVRFLIEAEYTLTVPEGRIVIFIQSAETGNARIVSEKKYVSSNSGTVSFSIDAKIPLTRTVSVIAALYTDYGQSSTTADSRVFEVVRSPPK